MDELLAISSANCTVVWQPAKHDEPVVHTHPSTCRVVKWNENNIVHVSAGDAGVLVIHKNGSKLLGTLPASEEPALGCSVNCVAFARGSKSLAAGCDDGIIHVWDLRRKVTHSLHALEGASPRSACHLVL